MEEFYAVSAVGKNSKTKQGSFEVFEMFTVGRVCLKKAGRDAGKCCVVIEDLENGYVTIDGQTRRKKCNVEHLEPTQKTVKIGKNEEHEKVKTELEKLGFKIKEKKEPKQPSQRPKKEKIQKKKTDSKKDQKKEKTKE